MERNPFDEFGYGRSGKHPDTCTFLDVSPFFKSSNVIVGVDTETGSLSRMAVKQELVMLTEYARFMNKKIPELLKEFVETKRLFEVEETMTRFKTALRQMSFGPEMRNSPFNFDEFSFRMAKKIEVEDNNEESVGFARQEEITTAAAEELEETTTMPTTTPGGPSVGQELGEAVGNVIEAVSGSTQDVIQIFTDVIDTVGSILQENLPPFVWEALCKATWYPYHEEKCRDMRCAACAPSIMAATAVCKTTFKNVRARCVEEVMGEGFCNACIKDFI
jgi:hypothetical protein